MFIINKCSKPRVLHIPFGYGHDKKGSGLRLIPLGPDKKGAPGSGSSQWQHATTDDDDQCSWQGPRIANSVTLRLIGGHRTHWRASR